MQWMKLLRQSYERLYEKAPLLILGQSCYLATVFFYGWRWALFPFLIQAPLIKRHHLWPILICFFLPLFVLPFWSPPLKEAKEGLFHFKIKNVMAENSFFSNNLLYKGRVGYQPCTLRIKHNESRPKANCDYLIQGSLVPGRYGGGYLKSTSMTPIAHTFSFAERRFHIKNILKNTIKKHVHSAEARSLLYAFATGECSEKALFSRFKKLGLVHLLCISGFHFALIAFFLHLFLRLLFSPKFSAMILLIALTFYCLFIGPTAPIWRAYLMASHALLAMLLNRSPSPLNGLGLALITLTLLSPQATTTIGFNFSFAATLAIFLLYPPLNEFLQKFFPIHTLEKIKKGPLYKQHFYLFSSILREALALSLSVHLAIIPLILCFFHAFPLTSLLTNLIFPSLFSLTLLLLLFSLFCPWLFFLNTYYTQALLDATAYFPTLPTLYVRHIPIWSVALYLTALFLGGMVYQQIKDLKKKYLAPLSFI